MTRCSYCKRRIDNLEALRVLLGKNHDHRMLPMCPACRMFILNSVDNKQHFKAGTSKSCDCNASQTQSQ